MDGVLNVYKPSGMTSHDVVQAVRRITRRKRIGHTGTLDPLATGVLVLCIGRATRIAQYLEAGEKEYRALMRLGITTDTLDADGRILISRSYSPPSREKLLNLFHAFTGSIMQNPPAYSAVKVAGVPSYKLARQGKARPLKPRPVKIFSIELTSFEDPLVGMTVRCSKGVYIRSLCADMGDALGTGAHLAGLTRTRSGRFAIEQAASIGQIADAESAGTLDQLMIPTDKALAELPEIALEEAESRKILHGSRIALMTVANIDGPVRVYDRLGRMLAVARAGEGELRPEIVFS